MRRLLLTVALLVAPAAAAQSGPVQVARLAAGADVNAFGYSVALIDDVAFVAAQTVGSGVPNDVYGYDQAGGSGPWTDRTTFPGTNGGFGRAVAAAGNRLAVGSPETLSPGEVYIFERAAPGSPWGERVRITAPDGGRVFDNFGGALAWDGDRLAVGDEYGPLRENSTPRVYIVERDPVSGGWAAVDSVRSPAGAVIDGFAVAVALSGDLLVVGAPGRANPGRTEGTVYIYRRGATPGTWTLEYDMGQAGWPGQSEGVGGVVGRSVAISGNQVLVGEPGYSVPGSPNSGRVFVVGQAVAGGPWAVSGQIEPAPQRPQARFGSALATSGDGLVVGAPGEESAAGAAYLFRRSGTTWAPRGRLVSNGHPAGGRLGEVVALAGQTALLGAPGENAAYVFEAPPVVQTRVQFIHGSAAMAANGPLEVYINQPTTSTTPDAVVGYRGGTAFVDVVAGQSLNVRVRPVTAPPPPQRREETLTSRQLSDGRYVVAVAGVPDVIRDLFDGPPDGSPPGLLVLLDQALTEALPPAPRLLSGGVPVVVVNTVTDAPPLDVVVAGTGQVLADGVRFGDESPPTTLPAGTHRIEVRDAATGALIEAVRFTLDGTEAAFPLALSGFLDPAANQNGPALALTATDASGTVVPGVNVTGTDEAPAAGLTMAVANPARGSVAVRYAVPAAGPARLVVVDVLGREVAVLAAGDRAAGSHEARLDAAALAPGVYVLRLDGAAGSLSRTVTVVR